MSGAGFWRGIQPHRLVRCTARSALLLAVPMASACTSPQQRVDLGDFQLENGEVIRNCRVGYRVFGHLDASRSNAVLVTPWMQGTTGALARDIGPGRLVDSSRYYVIAVDALGNGVSSSPSNSDLQKAGSFPRFSMRDIVETQYQLVTRTLHIPHLRAVIGISMGGMQALQWSTAHPDFMDKTIAIVGSPRSEPDDRLRWEAAISTVRTRPAWKRAAQALRQASLVGAVRELGVNTDDFARQAQAIIGLDVSAPFGGSMELAAAIVRSKVLVASTRRDEVVNPEPALEFARLTGGLVLELDGRCGHQAPSCDRRTLWAAVARFLAQ
jgi:homoserine O-acetyltransferase/O-succinyltransferase